MKKIIGSIVLVLALCISTRAQTNTVKGWSDVDRLSSGTDFLKVCPNSSAIVQADIKAGDLSEQSVDTLLGDTYCMTLVTTYAFGMNDAWQLFNKPDFIGSTTNGQLYDRITSYIIKHPDEQSKSLSVLIVTALITTPPAANLSHQ